MLIHGTVLLFFIVVGVPESLVDMGTEIVQPHPPPPQTHTHTHTHTHTPVFITVYNDFNLILFLNFLNSRICYSDYSDDGFKIGPDPYR